MMKNISNLVSVVALQLSFSLLFMSAFSSHFLFPSIVIVYHLVLVSILTVLQYTFLGFLLNAYPYKNTRWGKLAVGLFCAVPVFLLLILYLVDFVANSLGSHNVTFAVLLHFLPELDNLVRLLPITLAQLLLACTVLFFSLVWLYTKLADLLIAELHILFKPGGINSLLRNRVYAIKSATIALALITLCLFPLAKRLNAENRHIWQWEPLVSLFVFFDYFGDGEYKQIIAEKDNKERLHYKANQDFERRNVVIIISDSLRADRMGVYDYSRKNTPFLESLYQRGSLKRVDMALSTCPESACGIMSSLASRSFHELSTYNFKINELLWDQGYPVYYLLSGDQTYYEMLRWYFGTSITSYFDGNHSKRYGMNDDRLLLEGLEAVPDFSGKASFFYFHLMGTHYVGEKLNEFAHYQPADIETGWSAFAKSDDEVRSNRYDNGVLQTDDLIAQLFEALDNKGYLKDSLVVIIGDHGEGLGERGNYGHDKFVYQEDINIPMLIYDTRGADYQNLKFATQLDVAPTIIDRLGLPIPDVWKGQSLLNKSKKCCSVHQTRDKPIFALTYTEQGKIYKYMRWSDPKIQPQHEELYELNSDPDEKHNLITSIDKALLSILRQKLSEELSSY